jgi:DNA-directed RNA polymerase specialized sigma24 family protein
MVDPDKTPSQLLAWTRKPVQSRDKTPSHLTVAQVTAVSDGRHPERRAEVARLTLAGFTAQQIAHRLGITTRAVTRNRTAIRKTLEKAS